MPEPAAAPTPPAHPLDPPPAAPLSAAELARQLDGSGLASEVLAAVGSTSAELVQRARREAPTQPIVLAADLQTAGRGRLGRSWHGRPGASLMFSLAMPWSRDAARSTAVTLACGLAVADCLRAEGVPVALKWPNDLLLDGGKLGGILTELAEDALGRRSLVVGMGLNLIADAALRAAVGQPLADLAQALGPQAAQSGREQRLARLALALAAGARVYEAHGFAPLRERYMQACAYLGQAITLQSDGHVLHAGICRGVDDQGRLLLEADGAPGTDAGRAPGTQGAGGAQRGGALLAMIAGEISVRPDPQAAPATPAGAASAEPNPSPGVVP